MLTTDTTVTFKKQTVFHLRHNGEWADISVSQGRRDSELVGGRDTGWVTVNILSTFGSYGHHWCAIGSDQWWEFLVSLDKDYCLKKIMEQRDLKEFDSDATLAHMKKHVIEYLADGSISEADAENARECIRDIEHEIRWEHPTEELFGGHMRDNEYWSQEFYVYFQVRYTNRANGLWDKIWVPFVHMVRKSEVLQNAA